MELDLVKDWLVPVSTFVTLLTGSVGGWLSLREYRLKVQVDTRLAESAELESDIKLINLFISIMDIAHARGGNHVSEKAIDKILTPEMLDRFQMAGGKLEDILDNAIVRLPVGFAAQDAAIAAIWALGSRHPILTPIAMQGLASLAQFKGDVAQKYLDDLKSKHPKALAAA